MNGLAVPDDPRGTTTELDDYQSHVERALAAAVAIEFIRVAAPATPSITARYCEMVVSNSRVLAAGNPKVHMALLRHMVRWLRSLKPGSSELQW